MGMLSCSCGSNFQVFAWIAFCVSVVWIYSLANEVVNLLQVQPRSIDMPCMLTGCIFLGLWGGHEVI